MSVLDGPGEGTWSVFAAKVVAERDEALEKVLRVREETLQGAILALKLSGDRRGVRVITKLLEVAQEETRHARS